MQYADQHVDIRTGGDGFLKAAPPPPEDTPDRSPELVGGAPPQPGTHPPAGRWGEGPAMSHRRSRPPAEHADQRLGLYAAVGGQVVQSHAAVGHDPIGDSEISHETEHAGDLKSPQQKIERSSFVVDFLVLRHDPSPALRLEE